ncbi:histone-lysine N-methyltransferase set-1-like isoform 3-T3 [Clarias gariepinus]|uniref:histone-lysine N-methyltransferase set-1-like isoform X1 n=1 Tax=Clarias gariepinus TaxID=13013 RepID=UPI00234E3045|nr:histone-lysine N-methyltransferase set-1-like isoform X1 [Clarias gariepinus]
MHLNTTTELKMPRRISPRADAVHYATTKSDKTSKLDVKYISPEKGRGVFALASFSRGDFVAEYRGEMIDFNESQRRRRIYHDKCAVFMFDFKWKGKTWCIDAAKEDGSFGRLVNDDDKHPNCNMKKIEVDGKPHLCLFAVTDIKEGDEITYDYGGTDWPWRTKVMKDTTEHNVHEKQQHALQSTTGLDENTAMDSSVTEQVMKDTTEHNVHEKQQHALQSATGRDENTAMELSVTEQQSLSEDSEQDMRIPRLRRTKSIIRRWS